MKKYQKLKQTRSSKLFFIIQAILIMVMLYVFNSTVTQENHVNNVAHIIVQPKQYIQKISDSSTEAVSYTRKELFCLAQNIFFEARGADTDEKIRVANVTLNRVKSEKYADNVCTVVFEPYQFSWTLKKYDLDKIVSKNKIERRAWEESIEIAQLSLSGQVPDLTKGSMFYHTRQVDPKWSKHFTQTVTSKWHLYYREDK